MDVLDDAVADREPKRMHAHIALALEPEPLF